MRSFRARYGASPLHLLAHLALLPLCLWALLQVFAVSSAAGHIVLWLVAAAVLHDVLLLPAYSLLDRAGARAARSAVNYVRVPAGLSLLLLVTFWGTIAGKGEGAFRRVSDLGYDGDLGRWLLATAVLFALSALVYGVRRAGRGGGARR